ncbi:MAG: sialate O-acetylesterase [Granulosicoccus sp.]
MTAHACFVQRKHLRLFALLKNTSFALVAVFLLLGLASCDSSLETRDTLGGSQSLDDDDIDVSNEPASLVIELPDSINVTEGEASTVLPVSIRRTGSVSRRVVLSAQSADTQSPSLRAVFTNAELDVSDTQTNLNISLEIGSHPIFTQTRELRITATDQSGRTRSALLSVQITPTSLPDVYLLIGQSNMVGSSELGAKRAQPGEPDARNERIIQLNVTGNDDSNFSTALDFTDPARIFNRDPASLTPAVDPLHDGYEGDGKTGNQIGLGLSFAKSALANTSADIVLVPAAWSGTGFCRRPDSAFPESLGWLPDPDPNPALAGPLLFDRAVARTNAALELSGGILRGILWHQGEQDERSSCALVYERNLHRLIAALRTRIAPDARGSMARQSDSDVPFIAGTMSKGPPLAPFSESKLQVDAAHRTLPNKVAFTGVVNADDLVPPAFPCGQGSCIHFGAAAYRELGRRYYEKLFELQ